MTEFPFQLVVSPASPKGKTESLLCKALLRTVAGRREVYDAAWNEKPVIVKIFFHRTKARRHLKKEWNGLEQLQKRKLNSPQPLFCGKTEDGCSTMVIEKILNCSTAWDLFQNTSSEAEKLDLVFLVCRQLAKMHQKGVLQNDLHLGNFLVSGNKIFAIDPAQMSFYSAELPRKKSIHRLAVLAGCLSQDDNDAIDRLLKEYILARQWKYEESDRSLLLRQLDKCKKITIKRSLKKSLRTGKRYLKIKIGSYIGVIKKSFCEQANLHEFIEQLDSLETTDKILKNGNTCFVCRLNFNGNDVVIKRYNNKGLIHSLRHTIKRSRARRGWLNGLRLDMLGIATPQPLAYIEQRKGPLVWTSFLVTEFVQAQNFYCFMRNENITAGQRTKAAEQIKEVLGKLERNRITHGDLKQTNILITDTGVVLADLDAMKVHRLKCLFNIYRTKDLACIGNDI